jgi:hypothetical protein
MPEFNRSADVAAAVDDDGLVVCRAEDLLKASDWAMGTASAIASDLDRSGLAWVTRPSTGTDYVRIYRPGYKAGRLIDAVTRPSVAGDDFLREAAEGPSEILARIRELVCTT